MMLLTIDSWLYKFTSIQDNKLKNDIVWTVKFSINSLTKLFFDKEPKNITEIWVLKDRESYKKFNHAELNTTSRDEVAGYYSKDYNILALDINTGVGTIIHEMVHAYMRTNFPKAPSWFDEGLGSLYEGTRIENNLLWGDINWRLPLLKEMIKSKKVISFKELTSYTPQSFYNDKNISANYTEARYLLYYLQDKGLLVKYYKEFQKNIKNDPTGFNTLKKVLNIKDMKKFREEWEKYILKLK